jgi:uncharacterized heparinase superfamily protein
MLVPEKFLFLNSEATLSFPTAWNDPSLPKLWLYNLHYFDDLNAEEAASERADWHRCLIARWIADNPVGHGNGWEPYPTSLRIVNWIKWSLAGLSTDAGDVGARTTISQRDRVDPAAPEALGGDASGLSPTRRSSDRPELDTAAFHDSLATQARWLERRIEWHLLGNHLLANAKALVFAGLFFEGPEADRWLRKGLAIYDRELPEQVLPDGGHFERSPMYHAIIQEDLLDLLNLAQAYTGAIPEATLVIWRQTVQRMRCWLADMTHPDGRIALFNDAAFGIAAEPAALEAYAGRLGLPPVAADDAPPRTASTGTDQLVRSAQEEARRSLNRGNGGQPPAFPSAPLSIKRLLPSGYVRMANGPITAILDCAPIGPDYLPGHAHADTLSFELSLGTDRVIVNGGTSVYGIGPERQRQRGTAAHSTVEIDGADSSEVWAGFRVARRARVRDLDIRQSQDAIQVSAAHDGYRRLRGRPVHHRQWTLTNRQVVVADRIEGEYRDAVARFHLHPEVDITVCDGGMSGHIQTSAGLSLEWSSLTQARIAPSTWHPEFGLSCDSRCLVVPVIDGRAQLTLTLVRSDT